MDFPDKPAHIVPVSPPYTVRYGVSGIGLSYDDNRWFARCPHSPFSDMPCPQTPFHGHNSWTRTCPWKVPGPVSPRGQSFGASGWFPHPRRVSVYEPLLYKPHETGKSATQDLALRPCYRRHAESAYRTSCCSSLPFVATAMPHTDTPGRNPTMRKERHHHPGKRKSCSVHAGNYARYRIGRSPKALPSLFSCSIGNRARKAGSDSGWVFPTRCMFLRYSPARG